MDVLALIGVGLTVFVATNVDDIFVIAVFLADRAFRPGQVVVGQYLGMGDLIAVSVLGSLASLVVPAEWIALLGVVPLGLGVRSLLEVRNPDEDDGPVRSRKSKLLTVAGVTIANGGDNVGVYAPLFASYSPWRVAALVVLFLVMTGILCGAAAALLRHRRLGDATRRHGHVLLPIVLIGLGLWILFDAVPLITRLR